MILYYSFKNNIFQKSNDPEHGLFYFYFAPKAIISEEKSLYTPLSLFAEIGGYVGLLLGVSLWNLAELITQLISRILQIRIKKLSND